MESSEYDPMLDHEPLLEFPDIAFVYSQAHREDSLFKKYKDSQDSMDEGALHAL